MVRISVDLPDAVAKGLDRLAQDRRSWPERLLQEAAPHLMTNRTALSASIARGMVDVEAGRVTGHGTVMAELDRRVDDTEARGRPPS